MKSRLFLGTPGSARPVQPPVRGRCVQGTWPGGFPSRDSEERAVCVPPPPGLPATAPQPAPSPRTLGIKAGTVSWLHLWGGWGGITRPAEMRMLESPLWLSCLRPIHRHSLRWLN